MKTFPREYNNKPISFKSINIKFLSKMQTPRKHKKRWPYPRNARLV